MKKPKDDQVQGQTDFGMNTVTWQRMCVPLRQKYTIQENISAKHQWRRKSVVSEIVHIKAGYILNIRIE